MLSVSDLRRRVREDEADEAALDIQLMGLVKEKLKLKAFRKRMHWKWRTWCDDHGFPQEIALEEYEERRAKDPEKFAEEFPSILWQEARQKRFETEAAAAARDAEKAERRRAARDALRSEKLRVQEAKMRAYRAEHERAFDIEDLASIEAVSRVKEKVVRLERFEDERHALETRRLQAEAQAAREAAEEKAAEEKAAEEARRSNEERDALIADEALKNKVQALLICSGTVSGPGRSKPPIRRQDSITVRYVAETDALDAALLEFNIFPLADYMHRFPRAKDAAKQFPHLFLSSTLRVSGSRLGVQGTRALATCLAAGAFPRMTHLRLGWSAMEYSGCSALATALGAGPCAYLKHINLRGNGLGSGSVEALTKALRAEANAAPRLEIIDLASNEVGCKGANALAHLLMDPKAVPSLQRVNLESNKVGPQGANAIARAASTRPGLVSISLLSNRIGPGPQHALRRWAPATVRV